MTQKEQLTFILAGNPIPDNFWDNPEALWEEIPNEDGHPTWTLLQAVLFSRKLGDVPEHIDLIGHRHPKTQDSLLHWAVKWELCQEASLLLSQGADPYQKNKQGESPAELAKTSKEPSMHFLFEKHLDRVNRIRARKTIRQPQIEL